MNSGQDNVVTLKFDKTNSDLQELPIQNDTRNAEDIVKRAARSARRVCRESGAVLFFSPWRQKSRYL